MDTEPKRIEGLIRRAQEIAQDRDRGASELVALALALLADAIHTGHETTIEVARIICLGQPAMGSLWNACAAAVAEHDTPGRFVRVRVEMERAAAALERATNAALRNAFADCANPHVITLSYSGSVLRALRALQRSKPLAVTCGEGYPRFEGRRMAQELADAGAKVTVTADTALPAFLRTETAVVVGADGLARDYWINKVGTSGIAAMAWIKSAPVYVIASRDKALPSPPPNIDFGHSYFEQIPASLATLFLTDAGPLAPSDLPALAERYSVDSATLRQLLR